MFIKNVIVKKILPSLMLGLMLSFVPMLSYAGTLNSTVDRNKISLNETLALTVSYDEQVDSSSLDLTVLAENFEVLSANPQSANTVSIINGKRTRQAKTTWTVLLVAKKTGALSIPSLVVGNDKSNAITIDVSDGTQANTSDQPLEVWVSTSRDKVYPSQQLIVTVEISAQRNIADLNGPQLIINNAAVESVGQETFQRVDNGVARQIVVLKYAVFATQVGELTVPIMTYTGVQGGRRSIFGSSGSQVVARSEQLTVKVEEPPKSGSPPFDSAPWFPAENLTIASSWSGDKNAIKVGEPITRTIAIRALGQVANIIPPLERPSQSNTYKSYKDQPQLDTTFDSNGFIGVRLESEAIVASNVGELKLPALEVNWWNVDRQQWQSTKLPAETIQVLAADKSDNSEPLIEKPNLINDLSLDQSASSNSILLSSDDRALTIWHMLTVLLLLVCAVQTWLLFRLNSARGRLQDTPLDAHRASTEHEAWRQLKNAISDGQASSIRQHLAAWAKAALASEQAVSLRTLVSLTDNAEFALEIERLESELYQTEANSDTHFDSKKLLEPLTLLRKELLKSSSRKPVTGSLPALYPE